MPELRDYQREAVASVLRLRKEGLRRLVVHLPKLPRLLEAVAPRRE